MNRLFLHVALALIAHNKLADSVPHKSFKWESVLPLCNLGGFLKKVPGEVRRQLSKAKQATDAAVEARLKAASASAAATEANKTIVYKAVKLAAEQCIKTATTQMERVTTADLASTALAAKEIGHIEEFLGLLKAMSKGGSSNGYCLNKNGVTTALEETKKSDDECTDLSFDEGQDQLNFKPNIINGNGFKAFNEQEILDGTASKCSLLYKGSSDTASAADIFQKNGPHSAVQGFVMLKPKDTTNEAANLGKQDNIANEWAAKQTTTNAAKTVRRSSRTKKLGENTETCGEDAKQVIKNVIAKKKVVQLLTKLLKVTYPTDKKTQAQADAAAMIKSVAGDENKPADKILEKIENSAALKIHGDQTQPGQVKDLKETTALQTSILGQTSIAASRPPAEAKRCDPVNTQGTKKETDETCEKKEPGDDCKSPCKVFEENGAKKRKLNRKEMKKIKKKQECKMRKQKSTGGNSVVKTLFF
uniref:Variant surface glycoprotein 1125.4690 n=1 Tax=Trypanosoma brucei TaxID=5691 RepID=A0A1J0RAT9_9TRYP|nr:variant surface glycoprotein 1125.4690 [Trypanosoma brucei]